ncbi:hypothetical protein Tco_1383824 [Tanacetum coccineum]
MSADSAVTYTSVHSEARSWSIPSEILNDRLARQLLEQGTNNVPFRVLYMIPCSWGSCTSVYYSRAKHPEDLVPAEDEAPTPPLPPFFLSPRDTPPRKRLLLTTPRPSCEVGESFAAATARLPRPTMSHRVNYSLVDTMETRFRDTERRMMTALEMVNMRVSYPGRIPPKREYRSFQFTLRHLTMPSKDRVQTERAEIDVLRRKDFL